MILIVIYIERERERKRETERESCLKYTIRTSSTNKKGEQKIYN